MHNLIYNYITHPHQQCIQTCEMSIWKYSCRLVLQYLKISFSSIYNLTWSLSVQVQISMYEWWVIGCLIIFHDHQIINLLLNCDLITIVINNSIILHFINRIAIRDHIYFSFWICHLGYHLARITWAPQVMKFLSRPQVVL